jgi:hypothetical protein
MVTKITALEGSIAAGKEKEVTADKAKAYRHLNNLNLNKT